MAGNVTVWHRAGNEFRAAYRWWHKAALVFLPFLIKCVHSATKVMACERGRKVKGGKNGREKWELRSSGNCAARCLLEELTWCLGNSGALSLREPSLPKARCSLTLEDGGFKGGVEKSQECRYMVWPWAGLHLCFLATLCFQNSGIRSQNIWVGRDSWGSRSPNHK